MDLGLFVGMYREMIMKRSLFIMAAIGAFLAAASCAPAPARAEGGWHDHGEQDRNWHGRDWREHDRYDRGWGWHGPVIAVRPGYVGPSVVAVPGVVYAAPPYYAPPVYAAPMVVQQPQVIYAPGPAYVNPGISVGINIPLR